MESLRERHKRIVSELGQGNESFSEGEKAALEWLESDEPWNLEKKESDFLFDYLQIITLYVERMKGLSLKEVREKKGLSRYTVSKEAGVPPTTLKHWENDGMSPTPNTLAAFKKVCGILGVNPNDITF